MGKSMTQKGVSMAFQILARFIAIPAVLLLPLCADAQLKTVADDRAEAVQTVRAFFNALEAGNDTQFMSVVTPDFYSFEGGARFSGQEILSFIKAQRAAGRSYQWNVSEADVHVTGTHAWIAYLNKGSITDSSGTINQKWLESAFLEKQGDGWKIAFLHSTRVPK
jgi:ketosteroid isomerase-like protein